VKWFQIKAEKHISSFKWMIIRFLFVVRKIDAFYFDAGKISQIANLKSDGMS
jgi:hypothetical protein